MSTLHTVNKSPYERNALKSCLDHVTAGDRILLIEDGVLGGAQGRRFRPGADRREVGAARSTRWAPISPRAASAATI